MGCRPSPDLPPSLTPSTAWVTEPRGAAMERPATAPAVTPAAPPGIPRAPPANVAPALTAFWACWPAALENAPTTAEPKFAPLTTTRVMANAAPIVPTTIQRHTRHRCRVAQNNVPKSAFHGGGCNVCRPATVPRCTIAQPTGQAATATTL